MLIDERPTRSTDWFDTDGNGIVYGNGIPVNLSKILVIRSSIVVVWCMHGISSGVPVCSVSAVAYWCCGLSSGMIYKYGGIRRDMLVSANSDGVVVAYSITNGTVLQVVK
jgi:hypothetical protein